MTGVGDDRVRRAAPRRDLVWGVVLPSVVLGPFVAFGLAVIAVTGVGPAAPSRAAGHGTAMWLVAAMVSGTLHVVALRAAILARPSAVYEKPALRAAVAGVLLAGCATCGLAIAAQLPGLAWALQPGGNVFALALQIPGIALLLGPLVVGAKYLGILVRKPRTQRDP